MLQPHIGNGSSRDGQGAPMCELFLTSGNEVPRRCAPQNDKCGWCAKVRSPSSRAAELEQLDRRLPG